MEYFDFLRMVNLRIGGKIGGCTSTAFKVCRNRDRGLQIGGPTENLNEMKYNESNL